MVGMKSTLQMYKHFLSALYLRYVRGCCERAQTCHWRCWTPGRSPPKTHQNSFSSIQAPCLHGRTRSYSATHLHIEHSFGVALQRAQEQSALGVSHADGAVVGAHQQHPAGALLCRAQAAHASWAVALEHIQLLQSLRGERQNLTDQTDRNSKGDMASVSLLLRQSWPPIRWQVPQKECSRHCANIKPCLIERSPAGTSGSGCEKIWTSNVAAIRL